MSGSAPVSPQDCVWSCLDKVKSGLYYVQDAMSSLCSTDCKIYTLLIVGRVLQTAAVVAGIASLAVTFSAGSIALVGCVSALALGWFGTYVVQNKQQIAEALRIERPFVPGQPVGIVNWGNDCWLNSGLQLLAHVPAFERRMSQTPELASFLTSYRAAGAGAQKVAADIDVRQIRRALHDRTAGQVRLGPIQHDVVQLFEHLFQGGNALYTFDQRINGALGMPYSESILALDIERGASNLSLNSLLMHFFSHTTDLGQDRRLFFPQAPNDLLIQFKRFYQDSNGAFGKIEGPIELSERFPFPSQLVRSGENANYECDAFINHFGSSLSGGHYVAYLKKEGVWWYCSDSVVYEVSQGEALAAMKESYIIHFKKI